MILNQKVVEFIKKNIEIIENNYWKKLLAEVNDKLSEKEQTYLFCVLYTAGVFKEEIKEKGFEFSETDKKIASFDNLEIYYNKEEVYDDINKISFLKSLKEFMLMYNSYVFVNYKDKKIDIIFYAKRNCVIWGKDNQKELFEKYSKITLEKALNGDFKDLIHFVEYHSISKICVKTKEEMRDFRIEQYKQENGDNAKKEYEPDALDKLGCFVHNSCEVWLCDELIEENAKYFAKEYGENLFGNYNFPYELMKNLLYEKVFIHEFGHLVFEWGDIKDRVVQEKQANYFASYITNGNMDGFIVDFTRRQPKEYHNPYLIGDKKVENLYNGKL